MRQIQNLWENSETEFFDKSLKKDSSLLLHHSTLYWRILMKTILYSGF